MTFDQQLTQALKQRDAYLKRGKELACQVEDLKKQVDNQSIYPLHSESRAEINTAYIAACSEFPTITKGTKAFNYFYATLDVILLKVQPILNQHGLFLRQYTTRKDAWLHTRVEHISGQFFESQFHMNLPSRIEHKNSNPKMQYQQQRGSDRTYLRRYEALTLLGLHPEGEDNDGSKRKFGK